jgi:ketosteroid isomerase-like protein
MKRSVLVSVLAMLVCVGVASAVLAQGQTANSAPPNKATLEKVIAAWATMDPAKAAPFYAKDPSMVVYDIAPRKYNGWDAYDKGVRDVLKDVKAFTMKVNNDAEVHTSGNMAWATATVDGVMVNKDGSRTNLDARWTSIWEKRANNWQIVHEHFSVPLPESPAPAPTAPTKK